MCAVWGAHLFLQKSNLAWVVGFLGASSGSDASVFRTSLIWWLHSITADSREWRTPASTSPLPSFHRKPFIKQRVQLWTRRWAASLHPACFLYLCSCSREGCSALWRPAGRGSRVLPWTRPDITKTLVLRAWTWRLISWDTTWGHSLWFRLLHRRGATTWRGQGRNDGVSPNDRCGLQRLQFNMWLKTSIYYLTLILH